MKEIFGTNPFSDVDDIIAYKVEEEGDLLKVIEATSMRADMEHMSPEYILAHELTEFGDRPTVYPYLVVVNPVDEHNVLEFTYITKDMFE